MIELGHLYERLRAKPWPALAKNVGEFPLYESLLVGCADRALKGMHLNSSDIPTPDPATVDRVRSLREKEAPSEQEAEFLAYYELLEKIRLVLRAVSRESKTGSA
jgi:hypothetical protein